jgi:hypothetical protein
MRNEVRKPKTNFCAKWKYVTFYNRARFLIDALLNFDENLHLHNITESIYITKTALVDDFLLYFAFGMSLLSVQE